MTSPIEVRHNESDHQFEADVDGGLAMLTYHREGDCITFLHTAVPPESEGKGVASVVVKNALGYARAEHLRVVPQCAYVAGYMKRHAADYGAMLDP